MASHSALFAVAVLVLLQGQAVLPFFLNGILGNGRAGAGIGGIFGGGAAGTGIGGIFGGGAAGTGIGGIFGGGAAGIGGSGAAGTSGSGAGGASGSGAAGTSGSGADGAAGTSGSGAGGASGSGAGGASGSGAAGTSGSGAAGTSGANAGDAAGTSGSGAAGTSGSDAGGAAGTSGSGAGGAAANAAGILGGAVNAILTQMVEGAHSVQSNVETMVEAAINAADQQVANFMDGISARMNETIERLNEEAKQNQNNSNNWEGCGEQAIDNLASYGANLRSEISECGKTQFRKMGPMVEKFTEKAQEAQDIINYYITGAAECSKKGILTAPLCIAQVKTTATLREGQLAAVTMGMGVSAAAQVAQMKMDMAGCVAGQIAGMPTGGAKIMSDTVQCFSGTNSTH